MINLSVPRLSSVSGLGLKFKAGIVIVLIYILVAAIAPWIAPYDPLHQDIFNTLSPPGLLHWLGTDALGRDEFSRLIYAGRIDLLVAVAAVFFPFVIGTLLGIICGFYGGVVDAVVMRISDLVQAFPLYILMIALVFVFGEGVFALLVSYTLVDWVIYARLVRGEVLRIRGLDYIAAAKTAGLPDSRLLFVHIMPNTLQQTIIYVMSDLVFAILTVASFSFLGLGVPPPAPEWGSMINDGQDYIGTAWWLTVFTKMADQALLTVENLSISLGLPGSQITPVDGVTFTVEPGQALGLVGESGSGKSLTLRAIIGLLPRNSRVKGALAFKGRAYQPEALRGHGIGMIFQEPMIALNPTMRVGDFIAEAVRLREKLSQKQLQARVVELMNHVGIPNPQARLRAWPHELSGGLRQRIMIAAALATNPDLLLCDEPTTALDVCVQDQILGLLHNLATERRMSMIFVSHDLAVVSMLCQKIAVMYAGQVIEIGRTSALLQAPKHPYSAALLASVPSAGNGSERLQGIEGRPPDPSQFPTGCRFAERCAHVRPDCKTSSPDLRQVAPDHWSRCLYSDSFMQVQGV